MKPEFSKPFDLAAARAGAPFAGENGEAVRVLIWDRKHPTHPIVAIEEDGEQEAVAFRNDGTATHHESLGIVRKLVMLPLGFIDGKPVFVGDEVVNASGTVATAFVEIDLTSPASAWRWPAPAKVYPETQMTDAELHAKWASSPFHVSPLVFAANAALHHAIDAGQLVDAKQSAEAIRKAYADGQAIAYKHETGGRTARDMAIARAILAACKERFDGNLASNYSSDYIITRLSGIHIKAAIESVNQG